VVALDGPQGLDAVHPRHAYVKNDQIRRVLPEPVQGLLAAADAGGFHVTLLHTLDQGFPEIRLIVYE
jgi:hypothetical protein